MPLYSRRSMLLGATSLAALGGLGLAACGGSDTATTAAAEATTAASSAAASATSEATSAASEATSAAAAETAAAPAVTGPVSFGSNYSDEVPKTAMQAALDAFTAESGVAVDVNTVDHNTFQEQINSYLQGTPDDVFTWFAGYRMQFFAEKGLAGDISDVWANVGNMSDALKGSSTGADGKQYFVPYYFYPWALFYRKSVFEEKGYAIPKTMDELKALGDQMKKDGLTPIAFGDKDGWPAMGTFDYINMRVNGYDFHVSLMAGNEKWDDPKVKAVFETWAELLPYHQENSLGRTWQEAAQSLGKKEAGMYLLGMFVGRAVHGRRPRRSRLLRLPGDQPGVRPGLGRGTHRRLHDGSQPEEPRSGQGAPHVPVDAAPRKTCSSARAPTTSPPARTPTPRRTTRCRTRQSS